MIINLHQPSHLNPQTLDQAIEARRTFREFSDAPLTAKELSQLLWSAQGTTGTRGQRSAPSAGAQYPMQIYVAIGNIEDIPLGLYYYQSKNHELNLVAKKDLRELLCEAALDEQPWVNEASLIIILTANFEAMRDHFHDQPPHGKRGDRYIFLESGAIAQNIHLQATVSGLGAVLVGGFDDGKVTKALNLPENIQPTALICIGVKKLNSS